MNVARWKVWAVAGVGALAAGAHLSGEDPAAAREGATVTSPSQRAPAEPRRQSALNDYVANPARERVEGERGGPLFAGQSWAPPARPAPPKEEVAAKPVAPAFPYKYAGWYKEGRSGKTKVYLSKGNELLDVDAGQVLDGAWKIDSISEDRIGVTFIAGGQQLAVMVSNPVVEAAATAAAASQALLRAPAVARAPSRSPASIASSGSTQASSPMVVAGTMPFGMATQQHAGAQDVSPQPQPPAAVAAAPISAPTAVPSGRLGSEVPTTGSMPRGPAPTGTPMQIGPPPGGAFPSGPTPRGRLGL